ncbi:MAG: hypothetical protein KKF54_04305 [Candidatus Omnitrophica bacterium]|nr:hypothetical protein [Candidatus Omnitrophota bacterium]
MKKNVVSILVFVMGVGFSCCAVFSQDKIMFGADGGFIESYQNPNNIPSTKFDGFTLYSAVIQKTYTYEIVQFPYSVKEIPNIKLKSDVSGNLLGDGEIKDINNVFSRVRNGEIPVSISIAKTEEAGDWHDNSGAKVNKKGEIEKIVLCYPDYLWNQLGEVTYEDYNYALFSSSEQKLFFSSEILRLITKNEVAQRWKGAYGVEALSGKVAQEVVLKLLKDKGSADAKAVAIWSFSFFKGWTVVERVRRPLKTMYQSVPGQVVVKGVEIGGNNMSVAISDWKFLKEGIISLVGYVDGAAFAGSVTLREYMPRMGSAPTYKDEVMIIAPLVGEDKGWYVDGGSRRFYPSWTGENRGIKVPGISCIP